MTSVSWMVILTLIFYICNKSSPDFTCTAMCYDILTYTETVQLWEILHL